MEKRFQSVDALQLTLTNTVFGHTKDRKKAAGRALGTLVELITFYLLHAWGERDALSIERRLPEYRNPIVTHNVEFALHPVVRQEKVEIECAHRPVSLARLREHIPKSISGGFQPEDFFKSRQLLTSNDVLRNGCCLAETSGGMLLQVSLDKVAESMLTVTFSLLRRHPYAVVECKRVGIEEGMKKGPQTIEKAKQGAYVARALSSLQKVRLRDGRLGGFVTKENGPPLIGEHVQLLDQIVATNDADLLQHFSASIGVVSNHGNWFTALDRNKELEVLAGSYDWLLFLTDHGLAEFIEDLLLDAERISTRIRECFLASYTVKKSGNAFTKVKIDYQSHLELVEYFKTNSERIESWFELISPLQKSIDDLRVQLNTLRDKDWGGMEL